MSRALSTRPSFSRGFTSPGASSETIRLGRGFNSESSFGSNGFFPSAQAQANPSRSNPIRLIDRESFYGAAIGAGFGLRGYSARATLIVSVAFAATSMALEYLFPEEFPVSVKPPVRFAADLVVVLAGWSVAKAASGR